MVFGQERHVRLWIAVMEVGPRRLLLGECLAGTLGIPTPASAQHRGWGLHRYPAHCQGLDAFLMSDDLAGLPTREVGENSVTRARG